MVVFSTWTDIVLNRCYSLICVIWVLYSKAILYCYILSLSWEANYDMLFCHVIIIQMNIPSLFSFLLLELNMLRWGPTIQACSSLTVLGWKSYIYNAYMYVSCTLNSSLCAWCTRTERDCGRKKRKCSRQAAIALNGVGRARVHEKVKKS